MSFNTLVIYERVESITQNLKEIIDNLDSNAKEKDIVMAETYNYVLETCKEMKKYNCYKFTNKSKNIKEKNNIDRAIEGYNYYFKNKLADKNKIINGIIALLENVKIDIDKDLKIGAGKIYFDMTK
jgi:hypothetical protein